MKNLFLPFVVVALFAVGSCGDEASINPPVTKTTKSIVIKSLKLITIDSLAVIQQSQMNQLYDTLHMSGVGFPGAHQENLSFIKTDTLNYFSWKAYEIYDMDKGYASYPFNAGISFRIDSVNQQLKDISFSQSRSYDHYERHGLPTESDNTGFNIQISKAPYSIQDTVLTVRLSAKSLQEQITNLSGSSSGHSGSRVWYDRIVSMQPFDNSSVFELQFIIE